MGVNAECIVKVVAKPLSAHLSSTLCLFGTFEFRVLKNILSPTPQWSSELVQTFRDFMESFVAVLPSHIYAEHGLVGEHWFPF